MTEITTTPIDILEALAHSYGARTPEELAHALDQPADTVADTLAWLEHHHYTERATAWHLTAGAAYMLASTYQLAEAELQVLRDLKDCGGARTIEELAYNSGDDEEQLTDTIYRLLDNGYLQRITAWRRTPDALFAKQRLRRQNHHDQGPGVEEQPPGGGVAPIPVRLLPTAP